MGSTGRCARTRNARRRQGRLRSTRRIAKLETLEARALLTTVSDTLNDVGLNSVLEINTPAVFAGDKADAVEFDHTASLELESGSVAAAFTLNDANSRQALFSKDHFGNQDGGHLTVWIDDGRVEARLQSDARSVRLRSANGSIEAGVAHQVAVSFGESGFRLYVDGKPADGAIDFEQGLSANDNSLVIGASTSGRQGDRLNLNTPLDGQITALAVYDGELSLEAAEIMAGVVPTPLTDPATIDGVVYGTDGGEMLMGSYVIAGYGDDYIQGTPDADLLEAGHGEDVVHGGVGDDLIISRSDGREPVIAQNYDADDDPNGEVDPTTKTLYPEQPIAADDHFSGGAGADTFRFEILINAKERILFKHVEADGTIDWKGVTGENNEVHDHWVDKIGDDVIADFSRAEGDKIEFVGHTVDVYKVEHVDSDGDGVLDASVMHVQSNQGNAGAHNKDQLGTVTVYGDLVRESDYTVHAHANLGIVKTIAELGEALAPKQYSPVVTPGESRWAHASVLEENPLPEGAVFSLGQAVEFTGDEGDALSVPHAAPMEADNGTIAATFTVAQAEDRQGLFSKDHSYYQDGGHLTAWVLDGRVEVRLQSDTATSQSRYLRSDYGTVRPGEEHHVAISFGDDGARLYLDGELVDVEAEFTQGLAANDNPLVIGASAVSRQGEKAHLKDAMTGEVAELAFYDRALSAREISTLAGPQDDSPTNSEGTTGTGLDRLVDIIASDSGLSRNITEEEIAAGAEAADKMNALIVEAIRETDVAFDGRISRWDVHDISRYLRRNHADEWRRLHGDDAEGVETGFHLVRGDGARTYLFGDNNAVNRVADSIYHLGFRPEGGRLTNEDGNANASIRNVAFWLNELLEDDLRAGMLVGEAAADEAFASLA